MTFLIEDFQGITGEQSCQQNNKSDCVILPEVACVIYYNYNNIFYLASQVIILQTYWRRWLAQKYVENLKEDKKRTQEWERKEELRKQREKAERIKKEWDRRLNPKSKEDFDLLYSHLESMYTKKHSLG